MKQRWMTIGLTLVGMVFASAVVWAEEGSPIDPCISCHDTVTPGVVKQWQDSKHSKVGVKCYVCHQAKEDDPAGFEHNGFRVTSIVTPKYCDGCHPKQTQEFKDSLHDEAGFFSLSSYTIQGKEIVKDGVTFGKTANYKANHSRESAEAGCLDCHGTVIKVAKDGSLINWPNMGIGRFNPDGSVGTCAACHTRHTFSIEQARKPETCGNCHLGPDHPQREIYEESKHGNLVAANGEHYNWSAPPGQWGPEDIDAPTCAVCHMSGFGGAVESTHNVSARLKWELEPVFSWPTEAKYLTGKEKFPIDPAIGKRYEKIHDLPTGTLKEVKTGAPNPFAMAKKAAPEVYKAYVGKGKWWSKGDTRLDALGGTALRTPDDKREDMLAVCTNCHVRSWAEGDLRKADAVIDVYNAVALAIKVKYVDPIKKDKLDADIKFNGKSEVDNLWHEVWHHEGRIWRMGGFMQGQDWQHWEGSYEVADDGSHLADMYEKLKIRKAVKEKLGIK
ncbi:MAG: multiheme c-type cytochrome [Thermodesulfobacteriota bacterium]